MSTRVRTTAAAALASSMAIAGCTSSPASPAVSAVLWYPGATIIVLGALAIPPTVALPHGPSVTIVNRSDTPIDARIWTARVDVSVPAGYADQQTANHLAFQVQSNELHYLNAGRRGWVTGQNDAVVWIRFEPAPTTQAEPIWVQFDRPGPYKIEVAGTLDLAAPNAGLEFYALEDTTFSPLPRSLWIENHDGKYAITESR